MVKNNTTPAHSFYDVVIVGGAKIGSSIAWFLSQNSDFDGSILVVEKDMSYANSATAHTNSCMRQQFSNEINIRISQFAAEFVTEFQRFFNHDPRVPTVHFQSYGYMYLADNQEFADSLKEAQKLQEACGAGTKIMSAKDIAQAYPFYYLDDIVCGSHNLINEGYYDGNTVFDWWRRSAKEHGSEYIENEVVGIQVDQDQTQVESVQLATGERIQCGAIVNASGTRASGIAAMLGIDLPVEARKRYTYIFKAAKPLDRDLPLTIDPSGVHMRSDGEYYLAGCPPEHDPAVEVDDFVEDESLWTEKAWPAIAQRVPQFESVKLINSWVGHYDFNTLDQNAILGPHHQIPNFYFANGFSGHGFQQAPAVGRGLSELIVYGEFKSLDLSPFSYERVVLDQPFIERAVI